MLALVITSLVSRVFYQVQSKSSLEGPESVKSVQASGGYPGADL